MDSDEVLAERAAAAQLGDARAFTRLVERHQSAILANCRYLTRASADADDLAQEVFVKAYFKLSTFAGQARFGTWLQRIKINHCLNYLKHRQRREEVDVMEPALADSEALRQPAVVESARSLEEDRARVRSTLESLPDSMRVPLVLTDVDGLSYQEVADALGVGLSAAKMRIKRAREEFRRRYARSESIAGNKP